MGESKALSMSPENYNNPDYGFQIPIKDIIGKMYQNIEVLAFDHIEGGVKKRKNRVTQTRNRIFKCKCHSCGSIILRDYKYLTSIDAMPDCGCGSSNRINIRQENHRKDFTGTRFGKLVAREPCLDKDSPNYNKWLFDCDCGKTIYYVPSMLKYVQKHYPERVISCGCMTSENIKNAKENSIYTHGLSKHPLYPIHSGMIGRCYNPKDSNYKDYGGRGIKICDEWYTPGVPGNPGVVAFYNWAIENGYREGLTIDRIDNDGPYAPWNCRWVTQFDQKGNTRKNRHIMFNGNIYTYAEFERVSGFDRKKLSDYKHRKVSTALINLTLWNALHPDDIITISQDGVYRDKDGFIRMLPKYNLSFVD